MNEKIYHMKAVTCKFCYHYFAIRFKERENIICPNCGYDRVHLGRSFLGKENDQPPTKEE